MALEEKYYTHLQASNSQGPILSSQSLSLSQTPEKLFLG